MQTADVKKIPVAARILGLFYDQDAVSGILGDQEERYQRNRIKAGSLFAGTVYRYSLLMIFLSSALFSLYWEIAMFKNYIKTAIRNLKKNPGFSLINITGLSVGIACCLLIFQYVSFETGYDSYHPDADRIYRVAKTVRSEGRFDQFAANAYHLGPMLKEQFPQVEEYVRFGGQRQTQVTFGEVKYYEHQALKHADNSFFKVFTAPFIKGDPKTALAEPFTAVITESMARKYFGTKDPVGRSVLVDTVSYQITGLVKDQPKNTHLKFGLLMSICSKENDELIQRQIWNCPLYIKLKEKVDKDHFESLIAKIQPKPKVNRRNEAEQETINFLQSLQSIHLYSHLLWEVEPGGNPVYVYIFSVVGIFILLIAGMNFINLSTARSVNRSTEVGMRKVSGAHRGQLIVQFLGESIILTLAGLAGAIIIAGIALPGFNSITGVHFTYQDLFGLKSLLLVMLFLPGFGVLAGFYPAFVLSAFRPAAVLQGKTIRGAKGALLRKVLVVGQFSISIILIIGTIVIFRQINFMKNAYPGFDREQKLIVTFPRGMIVKPASCRIRTEFLDSPYVTAASFSSSVPSKWNYQWRLHPLGKAETHTRLVSCFQADQYFTGQYGLEMAAGQPFTQEIANDTSHIYLLLNEEAVNSFGWESPDEAVGKHIAAERLVICGVVKNFHSRGLQQKIEPMSIWLINDDYQYLSLTVNTKEASAAVSAAQNIFKKQFPDKIFEYFFLDDEFNSQYRTEEKLGSIFTVFTFLGIFIACLGLLGMAAYTVIQRKKEISIRKVLGASAGRLMLLLTAEFIKWIAFSAIIAWPVAWYGMKVWLQNFAYRVGVNADIFVLSFLIALIFSFVTVGVQAYRAANNDPVKSLKTE